MAGGTQAVRDTSGSGGSTNSIKVKPLDKIAQTRLSRILFCPDFSYRNSDTSCFLSFYYIVCPTQSQITKALRCSRHGRPDKGEKLPSKLAKAKKQWLYASKDKG